MRLRLQPVRTLLPMTPRWTIRPPVLPTAVLPTDRNGRTGSAAAALVLSAGRGRLANRVGPSGDTTIVAPPPGMMPPGGGMAGPSGIGGPRPGGQPVSPFGSPMMPGSLPGRFVRDSEMEKLMQQDLELEQQSQGLAWQYQQAPKEDREKLKKQIIEVVGKQFDVRQQRRLLELKRMEEELKRLRELLDRRTKARKQLVEKRVTDLVGPEEPGMEF